MLASDFCELSQCYCGGTQAEHSSRFARWQEILRTRAEGTSQWCPAARRAALGSRHKRSTKLYCS